MANALLVPGVTKEQLVAQGAETDRKVLEALDALDQPATRLEIASVGDLNVNSLNEILLRLVSRGWVFSRKETPAERAARVGPSANEFGGGRPANLYSRSNPVPVRTDPAYFEGTMSSVGGVGRAAKAGVINIKTKQKEKPVTITDERTRQTRAGVRQGVLNGLGDVYRTAQQIAALGRVSDSSVYRVLTELEEEGLVERKDPTKQRNQKFRLVKVSTAPQPIKQAALPEVPAAPSATPDIDAAVRVLVDAAAEADTFKSRIEVLEQENATLKAKIAQFRALL